MEVANPWPWIVFEPLHDGVEPPRPATDLAAGLDAKAYLEGREVTVYPGGSTALRLAGPEITLWEGWRAAIPLGFKAKLPLGWEMQVRTRSGLALKQGLIVANSPGTIDSDYPGEWMVIVQHTGKEKVAIRHGDRIAQLVLQDVYRLDWREGFVDVTTNRVGGFGSTGV
jgi:dUTP pyrophosphatase